MVLKRLVLVTAVLCMAGLAFAGEPGDTKPGWKGVDFSGGEVDFPAVLDGKPTILIFWASWCPYCKAFMPYLGEIQSDYGEDKMNILAVNVFEDNEDDPVAFLEALGFPVIALAGGESIAKVLLLDGVTGSIEEGKSADMIVLNHNLFEIPVTEIHKTAVQMTIFKGGLVYEGD